MSLTHHQVKCFKSPFMYDMEIGKIYNYVVLESVVEYWLADESWLVKEYMPIYAWAAAVMSKDLVPVKDIIDDNEEN